MSSCPLSIELTSPQAGHWTRKGPFTPATARSYGPETRACPNDINIQQNTQRNIHLHHFSAKQIVVIKDYLEIEQLQGAPSELL